MAGAHFSLEVIALRRQVRTSGVRGKSKVSTFETGRAIRFIER